MSESRFFRQLRHLLPDALPWRPKDVASEWVIGDDHTIGEPGLYIGGSEGTGLRLWRFVKALASVPAAAVAFVDSVFEDAFPSTTRELDEWSRQFGITPAALEADQRLQVGASWSATGGQSPGYLQGIVQAAGFPLYIHEWWEPGPPYVARDPRDYTAQPNAGTVQCTEVPDAHECSAFPDASQCNEFLANEPGYLVNIDLTQRAPPPVPDDPKYWPYFLYWGAETFPERAEIPASRRAELERFLLKHCPAQQWIVTLVDYV